jgi:hypothetical protein
MSWSGLIPGLEPKTDPRGWRIHNQTHTTQLVSQGINSIHPTTPNPKAEPNQPSSTSHQTYPERSTSTSIYANFQTSQSSPCENQKNPTTSLSTATLIGSEQQEEIETANNQSIRPIMRAREPPPKPATSSPPLLLQASFLKFCGQSGRISGKEKRGDGVSILRDEDLATLILI